MKMPWIRRCCFHHGGFLLLFTCLLTCLLCILFYIREDASIYLWTIFIIITFLLSLAVSTVVLFFRIYLVQLFRRKEHIERRRIALHEYQERKKLYGSIQSFCAQYPDI